MSEEAPAIDIGPTPYEEAMSDRVFEVCAVATAIKQQIGENWPELSPYCGMDMVALDKADTPEINTAMQAAQLVIVASLTQAYFTNEPKAEDYESSGS